MLLLLIEKAVWKNNDKHIYSFVKYQTMTSQLDIKQIQEVMAVSFIPVLEVHHDSLVMLSQQRLVT
jgi:hypothetical protein